MSNSTHKEQKKNKNGEEDGKGSYKLINNAAYGKNMVNKTKLHVTKYQNVK